MRTAITIGYPHNGKPVMISGPDVPVDKQRHDFKRRCVSGHDPEFKRIEIRETVDRYANLKKPQVPPASVTPTTLQTPEPVLTPPQPIPEASAQQKPSTTKPKQK